MRRLWWQLAHVIIGDITTITTIAITARIARPVPFLVNQY
jgi:hypothetical protein